MFEGEKVKLRGFEKEDVEAVHEAMNNPEMTQYLRMLQPFSKGDEEEWIEKTWEKRKEGEEYTFAIVEKSIGDVVGSISLTDINDVNRSAEIGIWIKEECWGQGYGTEAQKLLLKYGFEELNLHSIHGRAYGFNEKSKGLKKKVGMKQIGKLREGVYRHGQYWDIYYFDILKEEWEESELFSEE
ncbi:MAG: GNAT family N-acetyltransferase [Candidatus Aenigmatarchaeota archaeon]